MSVKNTVDAGFNLDPVEIRFVEEKTNVSHVRTWHRLWLLVLVELVQAAADPLELSVVGGANVDGFSRIDPRDTNAPNVFLKKNCLWWRPLDVLHSQSQQLQRKLFHLYEYSCLGNFNGTHSSNGTNICRTW